MNTIAENPTVPMRNVGLTVLATLCACVIAALFLTNWPTYHYTVRSGPIALYYYLLPSVLVIPVLCAEPRLAVRFFGEPVLWWFVVYVASGLLWLLAAQDFIEEAGQSWRLRLLSLSIFYTVTVFVSVSKRSWVALTILGCVAIACALNWFDVLRPERIVPKGIIVGVDQAGTGRGAGLFIDANAGAAFIVMGTMAALVYVPKSLRGLVLIGALLGVAPAYSRSGYVIFTVATLAAILLGLLGKKQSFLLLLGIPLLVSGIGLSYNYLLDHSENVHLQQIMERLSWFESRGEQTDDSIEGRAYGAAMAWRMFLDNPLVGGGPGATGRDVSIEAPHNVYLELMAEQGFLGLVLYVSLLVFVARHGWQLMRAARTLHGREIGKSMILFAVILSVHGLFIHNVLREAYTMYLLAFVIAAGAEAARVERAHASTADASRMAFARSVARG